MELFTVFTLICSLVCAFCVWRTWIAVDQCDAHADGLRTQQHLLTALQAEVAALQTAHNRLRGRFYATISSEPETRAIYPPAAPTNGSGDSYDVCENWALAQSQGPKSKAAACSCAYCEAQRRERAELRAAILPRPLQRKGE